MPRIKLWSRIAVAKIITIVLLIAILGSLFSALFRLMNKRGATDASVVKALTLRVALSIGLFALLLLSFQLGLISPQGLR